ncbi:hypothetical protein Tco_1465279 [Tanacetum coccineum]|uniref:Uncharacterized protein n=1 Tax=Tanacetum coccineum TaxID=301880 RepID=A0ABQ5H6X9_9ASTR
MFVIRESPGVIVVAYLGKLGKIMLGSAGVPFFFAKYFANFNITSLICSFVPPLFTMLVATSVSTTSVVDDNDPISAAGGIIAKGYESSTLSNIPLNVI